MPATATKRFEAIPFTPTPQRKEVVSRILRGLNEFETIFTDYQRGCEENCGACPKCLSRFVIISRMLSKPNARVWEVWEVSEDGEGLDISGILYLTDIVYGGDASAHYVFFDGQLSNKTQLIEDVIEWCFSDHPEANWKALRRLTVQIPAFAFALARHASKKLGFGGEFEYEHKGQTIAVEGVKRNAIPWRGDSEDLLVMGRLNEDDT